MSRGGLVRRGGPLGAEGGNSDDIAFLEILNTMMGDGDLLADLASRGFTLPELQILGVLNAPPLVPDLVRPLTPYVSLVPMINLFLETKRLQFLPGALYSIENLSVLSVRDNQLISLLPSVSRLPFQCELDLSNNCLLWLPYELKKFAMIPDQLKTAGNPLVLANIDHPRCRLPDHEIKLDVTRAIFHHRMWLRRTTAVTPLDGFGSARGATGRMSMFHASIRSSRPVVDPKWLKAYVPSEEPLPDLEHSTNVPSLMETVLRAASKQPSLYMFVANMPEELPSTLAMLLRHTRVDRMVELRNRRR